MALKLRIGVSLAALLLAGCQTLPYAAVAQPPRVVEVQDGSAARATQNARVYDATVAMVSRRFYDRESQGSTFRSEAAARRAGAVAQPDEPGFYTALNQMLETLGDNHTRARAPADVRRLAQWEAAAPTFGMQFTLVTDARTGEQLQYVMSLRPDGPAAQAGVQPGWLVRTLNGQPWAQSKVRDDGDNLVGFEDHKGSVHLLTINPAHLEREVGYLVRRPDDVVVIGLRNFDSVTAEWLEVQLAGLSAQPPAAVVLDIRGNPGGSMRAAAQMLGLFFSDRFRFASIGALDLESRISRTFGFMPTQTRPHPTPWLGPVAVVQSDRSASVAEVFAAAVQECGRGRVVGQRSAGAVVVAQEFWLPDGGLLTIGVTELGTISGKAIEKVGVTPDIPAIPTHEDIRAGEDIVVRAAAAVTLDEARTAGEWTPRVCAYT